VTFPELATSEPLVSDTRPWLPDYFMALASANTPDDGTGVFQARLSTISFTEIVDTIGTWGVSAGELAIVRLYQRWISSQPPHSPHLFAAWFNLGVSFSRIGDKNNAIIAYQTALVLRPDFDSAATNLGLTLESVGQTDAALLTWQKALQADDARTTLLNHRARLFEQLNKFDLAEQEMRRSLLINPKQPDVIQHWVHLRQKMCAWPIITDAIPGLSSDDLLRHIGPLSALALSDFIQFQCQSAEDWIARHTFKPGSMLSPVDGYRHERLRIGYLSSDFCRHAMSYLIAELFERHDRARFEIHGYCSSPDDQSTIRARIIASFDRFRGIKHLSDEQAARVIRDDEIDILVDLNGLTAGARPQILRWKPAPVQATYLGFVGPVPLPELDYMFCDDIVVPPDLASGYHPEPLYIAPHYQANDTKRTIGQATKRSSEALPDDQFVFCCFSNHYKITEEIFDAWMTILQRCDNSVIWLMGDNEWARRNMIARAGDFGIAGERLIFASRAGPDEYMARLTLADLFLDTFPYNAGTIASDAIRMGLPLLTLSGQAFSSRMAGRLLMAVGAAEGVAATVEEYVNIAVSLANNPQAYQNYKRIFDADAWRRQIGDIASFTRCYENSLAAIAKRGAVDQARPAAGVIAGKVPDELRSLVA
jgi:predicted O-linked N-acetylglucosamine transferase (SPINDLY family)